MLVRKQNYLCNIKTEIINKINYYFFLVSIFLVSGYAHFTPPPPGLTRVVVVVGGGYSRYFQLFSNLDDLSLFTVPISDGVSIHFKPSRTISLYAWPWQAVVHTHAECILAKASHLALFQLNKDDWCLAALDEVMSLVQGSPGWGLFGLSLGQCRFPQLNKTSHTHRKQTKPTKTFHILSGYILVPVLILSTTKLGNTHGNLILIHDTSIPFTRWLFTSSITNSKPLTRCPPPPWPFVG